MKWGMQMATVIDLDTYRIETFQLPYEPGRKAGLPEPQVWLVRKSDGAYAPLERESELSFGVLWERAHGIPEAETREWAQELADRYWGDPDAGWIEPAAAKKKG
jgi:hypothetical protein